MEEPTIFEEISRGRVPADIVYENEHVVAFREINPEAPVHVLVIPRTVMRNLSEATEVAPEVMGHLMQGIATTARNLGLEETGYRVVFNVGRDAQQTVQYLHGHILGGRVLQWPPG